jgi:hypothetical protein
MSSKKNTVEKEAMRELLRKHRLKHPGCKLNEKRCRSGISEDCIVKGDKSKFQKTGGCCKKCIAVINHEYYERVTKEKRRKKSVRFKKGTKT